MFERLFFLLFIIFFDWSKQAQSQNEVDQNPSLIGSFCAFSDSQPSKLITFLNESNNQRMDRILETARFSRPAFQICFITRISPHIFNYAAYSFFIQSLYAELHPNYLLFPLFPDSSRQDYAYHRKLVPILELLESSITDSCDYLVWMDADLIPLDLSWSIEDVILANPEGYIFLSKDVSTMVNTGSMILRNSYWTKRILLRWLEMKDAPDVFNEQLGFDRLFRVISNDPREINIIKERIVVLPIHILNSEAPAMWKQQSSHKILHLPAESVEYRAAVFRHAVQEICDFVRIKNNLQLNSQFGLNRRKLQDIAITIYERLVNEFEKEVNEVSTIYEIEPAHIHLYRTNLSKYCYALAYQEVEKERLSDTIEYPSNESRNITAHRIFGVQLLRRIVLSFLLDLAGERRSGDSIGNLPNYTDSKNLFTRLRDSLQGKESLIHLRHSFLNHPQQCQDLQSDQSCNNVELFATEFPETLKVSIEFSYETLHILTQNHSHDTHADRDGEITIIYEIIEYLTFIFPVLLVLLQNHPFKLLIHQMYHEFQTFIQLEWHRVIINTDHS